MKGTNINNGVSIVLCCYNSACRLPVTLNHIALQKVTPDIPWEVIIVNNNSTDNTVEIAKLEWAKHNCNVPFLIVDESEQGLSNARKKGVDSAKYGYLIFCDDDNWLGNNYVENASNILENNPAIGVIGGFIQAVTEGNPPIWFQSYSDWYACGSQSYKDGDISEKTYVWGAGMVLRKEIYYKILQLNIKSILSGRKGSSLASGEDSEISKWALLLGYKLWYSESLQLKHFIPEERLTISYLEKLFIGNKDCDYWLNKYNILINIKHLNYSKNKLIFKGLKLLIKSYIRISHNYRTSAQFMIGSIIKVSSMDDYYLAKKFHSLLIK